MCSFKINFNFDTGDKSETIYINNAENNHSNLTNYLKDLHKQFFKGLFSRLAPKKAQFNKLLFSIFIFTIFSCLMRVLLLSASSSYLKDFHEYFKLMILLVAFDLIAIFFLLFISKISVPNSNTQRNMHIILLSFITSIYKWIPLIVFPLVILQIWFIIFQISSAAGLFVFPKTVQRYWFLLATYVIFKLFINYALKIFFPALPCGFIIDFIYQKLL